MTSPAVEQDTICSMFVIPDVLREEDFFLEILYFAIDYHQLDIVKWLLKEGHNYAKNVFRYVCHLWHCETFIGYI